MRTALFSVFCSIALFASAQTPTPAPPQSASILILGAKAHLGNGQVIENSAIAFENGKLTLVADATTIRLNVRQYGKIFDAAGKHVYPGFIAPDARLGLVEIDAVRATQDFSDVGSLNPNLRALPAYNADSEVIPTVRGMGVLMAQVTPVGGSLAGFSSVVQLDAWNWEDAAVRPDDGLHLYWPAPRGMGADTAMARQRDEQRAQAIQSLHQYFREARAYHQNPAPAEKNLKLEAVRSVFAGQANLYVHADDARAIQEGILFAGQYGLRPVLVGAADAWRITDFLAAHQVSVLLAKTQRLPAREDEAIDQPYRTALALHQKNIPFAFTEAGHWRQRNLAFQAGQAVGYGLPYETAVSALTLQPARILGIGDRAGSLEVGKDATLFISEGDALDMRTARVTAAFIQGREINLDDKQKQLQRKFEAKYKQ